MIDINTEARWACTARMLCAQQTDIIILQRVRQELTTSIDHATDNVMTRHQATSR